MSLSLTIRGDGQPIVFLPSFRLDHVVMELAFEPIFASIEGWSRVYVDLPGTGESRPCEPNSDAVLDEVVLTLSSLFADQRFVLCGWSYGGYLATGLLRRLPDQVKGLFMICAGVRILKAQRNLADVQRSIPDPSWLAGVPEELHEYFQFAIGCQSKEVATRVAHALASRGPMDESFLDELQTHGYRLSDEDDVVTFNGTATMLVGRKDRIAGLRDQFDSLGSFPNASFIAAAQSGHFLPFEAPALLYAAMHDFLALVSRRT